MTDSDTKTEEFISGFLNEDLVRIILSGQTVKDEFTKVRIRPVSVKEELEFQAEEFRGAQVFHKNTDKDETAEYICSLLGTTFRQAQIESKNETASVLVSKKGQATLKRKKKPEENAGVSPSSGIDERYVLEAYSRGLSHNRKKKYILEEGVAVPFLVDLGVMTRDGKVINSKYDKFRQINRFLEFIRDILPEFDQDEEIRILDFGCGKSYLTFAVYYYLGILLDYKISITGLDLKKSVIDKCNALAEKYGYEKLRFYTGDIADYEGSDHADMVITLHACDTATDFALKKAVDLGAKVILSVPCCQHELNTQIKNDILEPVLEYGIIKERTAALITDALRAQILEYRGYRTQIMEFIDMENTPKNLLIRAVYTGKRADNLAKIDAVLDEFHLDPTLYRLLC